MPEKFLKNGRKNMEVIISDEVENSLFEYLGFLLLYPISFKRAYQKYCNMRDKILQIGQTPFMYPICKYKDLGQIFDKKGQPLNKFLRQFVYQDEAKHPWTFSYLINPDTNQIRIIKMMYSSYIKENDDIILQDKINRIITECINKVLNNL